jgi:phosphopantothenoylcysteine decarboxylase / phosphopantothenate---cysteine ligase
MLKGKTIVLGVTGSIAAFKAPDLASRLTQAGARVNVIMTPEAVEFVTPLTFRSLTHRPVVTKMFELESEYSVEHVALAEAADMVIVAPATANIISKFVTGMADDMLSCTVLATKAPVLVSPAMNVNMYQNSVTQDNISKLKARGFHFVGPATGRLASGITGEGRFIEVEKIIEAAERLPAKKSDLKGKNIVVTAGGTQEAIDPVRCITNYSSGKMGYAIAEAARNRGASVTLVTAPANIEKPSGVQVVEVISAEDMLNAVMKAAVKADALIMAAAVADYRPAAPAKQKIKRQNLSTLTLKLEKTPDILERAKGNFLRIGFAAESQDLVANAMDKLKRKHLDLIVANNISGKNRVFGADTNQVIIIDKTGKADELPLMPKREVAEKILDKVALLLKKK